MEGHISVNMLGLRYKYEFGDVGPHVYNFPPIGTLAAKYEELGGEVKWMGKPDKVI